MNNNPADFRDKFKEELNILYEAHAAKRDKHFDQYQEGMCDAIDIVEQIFDKIYKELESEGYTEIILPEEDLQIHLGKANIKFLNNENN